MRKRKVILFFGLLLTVSMLVGFCGKTSNVYAAKSINNTVKKEKIKNTIEMNQKLLKTLYDRDVELKKWEMFILNKQKITKTYFFIRKKSLVSFQNEVVKKLATDLNENSLYTKYILKCFGWKKDLISFIFRNGKYGQVDAKFEKMGCCPELIIKISRKFNSQEEKCIFIDGLKKEILNEKNENRKIFFNPCDRDNNVCHMCIVLM